MKRVLISVEGQTEETFIRDVLNNYFELLDIYLIPTLITTKVIKDGPNFKGGMTNYGKIKRDLLRLLNDRDAVAVTTMYDLYELPRDFPGYNNRPPQPYDKVRHLEESFANDIGDHRFKPYLQLHEFETFLFVAPDITAQELEFNSSQLGAITQIRTLFATPEEINDNPNTSPSKRIKNIYDSYDKTFDGPFVTSSVGLDQLRSACPHFDEWIKWLEGL
ncbi:MAG: DUF4276 family protein [Anaerolineae bacterium]|nr:DUF4276 family protein [Anaerolineae bacterium]